MRYIVFLLDAGMAGTDSAEFAEFDDSVTDDELSAEAWERALDHASSYGVYTMSDMPDDWHSDEYSDNIDGYWEEYDPEKHDGLIVGNGPAFANYPN